MVEACGVGVILGVGSVGYDEYLNIFIQSASCPETISLIAVNLIERLFELNASSLQFYMHERQSIDEYGHIVAGIVVSLLLFVLVDDLEVVVMNILLVNQVDVLGLASVSFEDLDMVFLYLGGLRFNAFVLVGNDIIEETLPFAVGEGVIVEFLQLHTEIIHEVLFLVDREVVVSLLCEGLDELLLQLCFRLVFIALAVNRLIVANNRVVFVFCNDVICHSLMPFA